MIVPKGLTHVVHAGKVEAIIGMFFADREGQIGAVMGTTLPEQYHKYPVVTPEVVVHVDVDYNTGKPYRITVKDIGTYPLRYDIRSLAEQWYKGMGLWKYVYVEPVDVTYAGWEQRVRMMAEQERQRRREERRRELLEEVKNGEEIAPGVYMGKNGPIMGNLTRPRWLRRAWKEALEDADAEVPAAKITQEEGDEEFYKVWKLYWEGKKDDRNG